MAVFGSTQFGFKQTSVPVEEPDNDIARLMFYFDCVCEAIEYDDSDVARLRNFRNFRSLSYVEVRLLIALCLALRPDVFDDKVFFHSDALCGNSSNKFFEISQVSNQLLAVRSIIIAGRQRRVKKIMTYKMSWLYDFYLYPMQRLAQQYS